MGLSVVSPCLPTSAYYTTHPNHSVPKLFHPHNTGPHPPQRPRHSHNPSPRVSAPAIRRPERLRREDAEYLHRELGQSQEAEFERTNVGGGGGLREGTGAVGGVKGGDGRKGRGA